MILLLGATGYIGSVFAEELKKREESFLPVSRKDSDGYSFNRLLEISALMKAELIINCAAYTGGNAIANCEKDKAQTIQANLLLPQRLADVCDMTGASLMQLSTGCLYQGIPPYCDSVSGNPGYNENDPPMLTIDTGANPYTASKELCERVVRKYERHYLMRLRLPFDEIDHPRNLLTKLMQYSDTFSQTQSLSHRRDFVTACLDLYERGAVYGTYNLTNPGYITTGHIAMLIEDKLKLGRKWNFIDVPTDPKRSVCVLNTDKAARVGIKMRPVEEAVEWSLKNWVPLPKPAASRSCAS